MSGINTVFTITRLNVVMIMMIIMSPLPSPPLLVQDPLSGNTGSLEVCAEVFQHGRGTTQVTQWWVSVAEGAGDLGECVRANAAI